MSPLLIAGIGIVFVVLAIAWARIHAFFALVLAAILVAMLGVATGLMPESYAAAVELVMTELGSTAGKIAFIIVAAAVIGDCMSESGAASRIVDALLRVFGEKRSDAALVVAGFILSIPVFFDTVFILLLPLARELARRSGGNYVTYLLAICAGGVITHSTVPPTPGPLVLAEIVKLDLGSAILAGIAVGLPTAAVGLFLAKKLGSRVPVQPAALPSSATPAAAPRPSLGMSLLPVIAPLVLIAIATATSHYQLEGGLGRAVEFAGNKNVALLVALVLALLLVAGRRPWREIGTMMGAGLETAGAIVLITSAGGAFGAMIKRVGISEAVQDLTSGGAVDAILLGWFLAVAVRVAQGSATVAMITAGGIMMSLGPEALAGTHPVYLYLAVGYGSFCCSWMNDSGFWLVSRLGGLTERESLRTWTLLTIGISVAGLIVTWICARLLPLSPG